MSAFSPASAAFARTSAVSETSAKRSDVYSGQKKPKPTLSGSTANGSWTAAIFRRISFADIMRQVAGFFTGVLGGRGAWPREIMEFNFYLNATSSAPRCGRPLRHRF
jgi:hypothetical protein